jgi:hypothetical protein
MIKIYGDYIGVKGAREGTSWFIYRTVTTVWINILYICWGDNRAMLVYIGRYGIGLCFLYMGFLGVVHLTYCYIPYW